MSDASVLNYRNPAEVRNQGFAALHNALGAVGTVYFLRQFSGGTGNWTEERKSILADVSEESFERELAAWRENKGGVRDEGKAVREKVIYTS